MRMGFADVLFIIKNFRNLRNWLSADADVANATGFLSRKPEKSEKRVPLTRIFLSGI